MCFGFAILKKLPKLLLHPFGPILCTTIRALSSEKAPEIAGVAALSGRLHGDRVRADSGQRVRTELGQSWDKELRPRQRVCVMIRMIRSVY